VSGDTFTDVKDWSRKRGFGIVVDFVPPTTAPAAVTVVLPELIEDAPILVDGPAVPTLDPEELRELKFADAKAYAFDMYGIKARGWAELIAEYTEARGC
jgi:hypothetical protein